MSRVPTKDVLRVDLVDLARLLKDRLPPSEHTHYQAYMSALGRDDLVSVCRMADERTDPQLWVDADPLVYMAVRQAYLFPTKIPQKGGSKARENAWRKFMDNEARCKRVNKRFRYLRLVPWRIPKLSRGALSYSEVIQIREHISRLLGDFWKGYCEIITQPAFGPGMSISSRDAARTSLPFKLSDEVTVTKSAIPVWRDFLRGSLHEPWVNLRRVGKQLKLEERVSVVPGCRITFVPKTSVIERTIAIEPSANISMQLAIHRYLIKRCRRRGLDLTDQTRNRSFAFEASKTGLSATIDLSSASDLIAFEVVRTLVPKDWFELLCALRSPTGQHGDKAVVFEKFSSMGNGFTFILESIIFYAIALVVCCESCTQISVYGDDIIVPSTHYPRMVRVLSFFGFKVNTKKSFSEGPFRESCGLDAFKGVDVRPLFIRDRKITVVQGIAVHNHFFRRGMYDVCKYIERLIPTHRQVYGPPGPDAGFLFTEEPEKLAKSRSWSKELQAFKYKTLVEVPVRQRFPSRFLLAASLLDGGENSRGATLRSVTKLVTKAAYRDY